MSIFLMTFILIYLKTYLAIFRKCLYFLVSNAGVLTILILQSTDYQHYSSSKIFANDEAYRLVKRLLRKSRSILPDFIGAKLLIFRKSHKLFLLYLHFRWLFTFSFCQDMLKVLKMRFLQKSHFSQMILPLLDLFQ